MKRYDVKMWCKRAAGSSRIRRIAGDFSITILASVLYTFARQIVVFPLLAAHLSAGSYGTLLTIIGLVNVCTALVGGSLNNVRLVQNTKYEEQRFFGDFNLLCLLGGVCSIGISGALWWVFRYSWQIALLLTAYILVSELYQYAITFYRLELNFKRIFLANVIAGAAYIVAAMVFATEQCWPLIFLVGEGTALIYVTTTTKFYREPLTCTPLFADTTKRLAAIMLAGLVGNLLMYADRMMIYPAMGAASVSHYSVAAFFGKSAGIVMTPIAGVLLGYFSQKDFVHSKKLFMLVNGISLIALAAFSVGCMLLAPWFTKLLYPTLFAQARPYIFLANLGVVAGIAGNMAQPMILKCCSANWLLGVQVLYGGAYLLLSLALMPLHGLLGFCWATILANAVRLLALYVLGAWKL